jgi:hypothetical protein
MKKTLTILFVLSQFVSFSQANSNTKKQIDPMYVSFVTAIDTAYAQKDGFWLNGYVVNIDHDKARELHGKIIIISGEVFIVKGLKSYTDNMERQGRANGAKHIGSPRIGIVKSF